MDALGWREENLTAPALRPPDPPTPRIWLMPDSEGYSKCIERPKKNHRTSNAAAGYIIVDANGGLNQMRMGVRPRLCFSFKIVNL